MLKKKTKEVEVKTDGENKVNAAPVSEAKAAPVNEVPTQVTEIEAEVEAEVEEVVEEVESTELVEAKAKPTEMASGSFKQQSDEEGMEGLELGYFSFPTVKLPSEGKFETSTGQKLGESFDVVVIASKAKYLIKPEGADAKDKRLNYSYDALTTVDGKTMADLKAEWSCSKLDVKKYLEVPARLIRSSEDTELEGTMVMLSIPPSGVQRFSGYKMELDFLNKGHIKEVVTKCKVGAKVTNAVNDFYPWLFELVGKA